MQRAAFPRGNWYVLVLAACAMLLGGCLTANNTVQGPQILSALPQGWQPLTQGRGGILGRNNTGPAWTEINIDNDLTPEYLLFFTYDNGQVGAIIYDQQTGAAAASNATPVPAPNQPAGQYISYQVEPSFWTRSDAPDTVGYVAPPGVTFEQLRVEQVQRAGGATQGAGAANPQPGDSTPPNNELIIYGGSTVISVLWWRNAFNGYGIAQMEAAGGLQPDARTGDVMRPLQRVVGQTPLSGLLARSVLCNEVRFTRTDTGEPPDVITPIYQSAVRYVESSGGIVFCQDAPVSPYYPEGVVLAYLRPAPAGAATAGAPPANLLWSGLDATQQARLAALVDLNGPEVAGAPPLIVRDLRARPSVPLPPDFRTSGGAVTTNVCAEAVTEDGLTLRRLLFDLVYEPVREVSGVITAEHFAIANIADVTNVFANCALIIP